MRGPPKLISLLSSPLGRDWGSGHYHLTGGGRFLKLHRRIRQAAPSFSSKIYSQYFSLKSKSSPDRQINGSHAIIGC